MAKRKRTQTRAVLENRDRQGRGRGEGASYKPWLLVHDVASQGRSSRIASGGRVVHTLSDWETAALRDFQWDPTVVDVKEQFPLAQRDTLRIAVEINVKHPADGSPREPIVMTTDFLVTRMVAGRLERSAYAVKENAAIDPLIARTRGQRLSVGRKLQKLRIERLYWEAGDVPFEVLTEDKLSKVRKTNIEFLLNVKPDPERPSGYWAGAMVAAYAAIAAGGGRSLDWIARSLDAEGVLRRADFTTASRLLCARRAMAFDMDRPFALSRPASDFVVVAAVAAQAEAA